MQTNNNYRLTREEKIEKLEAENAWLRIENERMKADLERLYNLSVPKIEGLLEDLFKAYREVASKRRVDP